MINTPFKKVSLLFSTGVSVIGGTYYQLFKGESLETQSYSFPGYKIKEFSNNDFQEYWPKIKTNLKDHISKYKYENIELSENYYPIIADKRHSVLSNEEFDIGNEFILFLNNDLLKFIDNLEKVKKENKKLKETIKIRKKKFDSSEKNKIPYNVKDEKIKEIVKGLPKSNESKRYWVEITRNNDAGKIKLEVYSRYLLWNKKSKDFSIYTEKLATDELTGFKKMSYEKILSERVVRVFGNKVNWLGEGIKNPTFDQYKNGYKPRWSNEALNFVKLGSALVLHKDEHSPNYYIATNKHVVNSIIPTFIKKNNSSYIYTNHYKIQPDKNKMPLHVSPIDAFFNWPQSPYFDPKNANLKGYITFGANEPINGDKTTDSRFLNTIFEFKDKNKDIIKSIKLINDFSYPNISLNSAFSTYKWSLNNSFLELDTLKINKKIKHGKSPRLLNEIDKNAADFVILKVEFADEASDPFYEWWSERPTKRRALNENDLFQKSRPIYDNFSFSWEYGTEINNPYWSAGYASHKNSCDANKKNAPNQKISIKQGISENRINDIFWSGYSKRNVIGKLVFEKDHWNQISGASGSPVFDKNGNALGLLWSGNSPKNNNCSKYGLEWFNLFFWFGLNLSNEYNSIKNKKTEDGLQNFSIPNFDFISDESKYSLFSVLNKTRNF